MYLVRFIRRDFQADEEYFYSRLADAEYHINLFEQDDSDLYDRIQLIHTDTGTETILRELTF